MKKNIISLLLLLLMVACSKENTNSSQQYQSRESLKLKPGDRIHLFGGYDLEPKWLKKTSGYNAKIIRFIDNKIEGRSGDQRLSAIIEFEEELEFDEFRSTFGLIMGPWEQQEWIAEGVVDLHLITHEIESIDEFTEDTAKWMESHARYKRI